MVIDGLDQKFTGNEIDGETRILQGMTNDRRTAQN